nr:PREDICTED: galactokinase-like [Bemisia tabaci]
MPDPKRTIPVEKLLEQGCDAFENEFKTKPEVAACAPGRVNLIGEHLDYNDGFVLPMALPMVTIVVGRKNNSKTIRIITLESDSDKPSRVEFPIPSVKALEPTDDPPKWANYVKGTLKNFEGDIPGFDALIISDVPMGGGLSSSAALEVATYTFLEELTKQRTKSLVQKALSCQAAERNFVGMPCGIMDQFISVMGNEGAALLIDCRTNTAQSVPIRSKEHVFLITNSNVRHELGSSEFAARVKQCAEAAQVLNKKKLRDATLNDIEEANKKGLLQDEIYRRARHVVTEIERTKKAAKALEAGHLEDFGRLMYESHKSLREDYEVTCSELNELVQLASEVEGVLGSRMTGGGFGGCTVTLVAKDKVHNVVNHISDKYSRTPIFYVATPSAGARSLSIAS